MRWQQVLIVGVHAAPHTDADAAREPVRGPCAGRDRGRRADAPRPRPTLPSKRLPRLDSDPRWSVLNSLWLHAAAGPLRAAARRDGHPLAGCRRRRRPSGSRRHHRRRQPVRPAEPEPQVHQERIELRRDTHERPASAPRWAIASRCQTTTRRSSRCRSRSRSTARIRRRRFSTRTATSRSRRPTPRAPTAASRGS